MKTFFISTIGLFLCLGLLQAQNDTMYIMHGGSVIGKYKTTMIDSIIFYNPVPVYPISIQTVNIPSGTFTMGSPIDEAFLNDEEVEHQVTLSAFSMSKYEITNSQFAAFLNTKNIGSDGLYAAGANPTQVLINASSGNNDWGLHYNGNEWVPVRGYENHPVIYVTWFGANEYATYAGGRLPTEAEWEYACRANTTTPFNTGTCLNDLQANYIWEYPYSTCTNLNLNSPDKTESVDTYTANAFGLHNMHGNVSEWCSDWYGTYPTTEQTNPTGPSTGDISVIRGGNWECIAQDCRSAKREGSYPKYSYNRVGFRIVLEP